MAKPDYAKIGRTIRKLRLALYEKDKRYSLRQVALRIGIEPSYLSKVERGERAPLSEEKIKLLARDLGKPVHQILALWGKVDSGIQEILLGDPERMAEAVQRLGRMDDHDLELFVDGCAVGCE